MNQKKQTSSNSGPCHQIWSANLPPFTEARDVDLKGRVVFLFSGASHYLTGRNIPVDGGYTAK
jgi:hypothetical protein